jgi:hypothetical protein
MHAQETQLPAQDNANKIESILFMQPRVSSHGHLIKMKSRQPVNTQTRPLSGSLAGNSRLLVFFFFSIMVSAASDYIAFDLINKAIPE